MLGLSSTFITFIEDWMVLQLFLVPNCISLALIYTSFTALKTLLQKNSKQSRVDPSCFFLQFTKLRIFALSLSYNYYYCIHCSNVKFTQIITQQESTVILLCFSPQCSPHLHPDGLMKDRLHVSISHYP